MVLHHNKSVYRLQGISSKPSTKLSMCTAVIYSTKFVMCAVLCLYSAEVIILLRYLNLRVLNT